MTNHEPRPPARPEPGMARSDAQNDLAFIKQVVARTSQRIDAHAFHCVHWGWIVLLWYPIGNWLWLRDAAGPYIGLGVAAVIVGVILSAVRGARAARQPRVAGGNAVVEHQLRMIAFANLVAGGVLSAVSPAVTGAEFIRGENVPIIWGLVYANMAFMMGVAYSRDFLVSGVVIFAGCVLAIVLQQYNGYILGPFMGLGMLVPGLRAEARVRRLAAQGPAPALADA
ncbi:MAG: hypothetical protein AAF628_29795 [Planctomycetota bacterium]